MTADITFDGRVALVTGAGSGLGRSYALDLARRGAAVVVNDVDADAASRVATAIEEHGGTAVAGPVSVATPGSGDSLVATAVEHFGRIDVVVNNAGILRDHSFARIELDELRATMDVHLLGAFHVTQPAFRLMKEQGYGRIVNTTSAVALWGNFGQASYAAAKMGLVGLTNVLAVEGGRYGILANAVAPIARTPGAAGLDIFDAFGDAVAPEQVTPLVTYLASDRCATTQHLFSVGGGQFARVFAGVTEGWFADDPTPPTAEDVERHMEQIVSLEGSRVPDGLADEAVRLLDLIKASTTPTTGSAQE